MKYGINYIIVLLILSSYLTVYSLIVGSNAAVSVANLTVFPAVANNQMLGFTAFPNGITLANASTTCLYNALFPIGGPITMNGGLLNLAKDLSITGTNTYLANAGSFNGNTNAIILPQQVTTFTTSGAIVIGNADLVFNSNVTLNGLLTFTNSCVVEGGGYILDVTAGGIAVGRNSSAVLLKNMILKNASGNRFYCIDNTGTFSLENVTWVLDANYSFTQGTLQIFDEVKITGLNRIFAYASTQTMVINSNSTLFFDTTMTFSYAATANNVVLFDDNTAFLHLYETTLFVSNAGLNLTKGSLVIDGQCSVISTATSAAQGISFGDNILPANNLMTMVLAESGLNIKSGFLVYQNV
ncbi:MAG: hypothetical protein NTX86_00180 [Candidatus Dependentiae bacterium]|nr:hypothetical protein [Candidatus Dependentiae bacterium]